MPYYMVHIACYTELKLQICNYVQKERICRENSKYAPDENFCGHCGCQLLPPCIPIILMVSPTQVPLSCSNMSHSCFLQPSVSEEGKQTSDMWTNNFLCPNLLWHEIDITIRLDSPPPHFDKGSLCQWSWLRIGRDLCTGGTTLWFNFNALTRIIRQLCSKVNSISMVCRMAWTHFNRSVAALDTSGERTNPGDLQTSAIMLRFHFLQVGAFSANQA